MDITTERPRPEVAVIALVGELDGSNFERLIETARIARDGGASTIVLDLAGLTYMGSSGLVAIQSTALLLRGQEPPSPEDGWDAIHRLGREVESDTGGSAPLHLAAPTPPVDRVLERTGMKSLFPVHADRHAALEAVGAG
jgi:anti-anti-sigma regulatory factor